MKIKKIVNNPQALIGICLIIFLIFMGLFADIIAPHEPNEMNIEQKYAACSSNYPLGTDQLGRCELSRLIYGARLSLGIAIPTLIILTVLGLFVGSLCAYKGGIVDQIFIIICDVFIAFPPLIIAIALIGSLGNNGAVILIAMIISMWAWYVRIARTYCRKETSKDYVLSAKVAGASEGKILFKHIMPNVLPQYIIYACLGVASTIIMISGFSFLGVGFPPGTAEWGAMMNEARASIYTSPMLIMWPGIFVFLAAGGFIFLGEALRDILTPEDDLL